jgi:hypothetical protein
MFLRHTEEGDVHALSPVSGRRWGRAASAGRASEDEGGELWIFRRYP